MWIWIVVVVAVVAIGAAIAIVAIRAKRRTDRLRRLFGSEYDRTVQRFDSRRKAEAELEARLRRREAIDLRPLSDDAHGRYVTLWKESQKAFVDSPSSAIGQALGLLTDLMRERGYPAEGFERRSEDLSVDHPDLAERYRKAYSVAQANDRGEATTEDLRRAMKDFEALIEALLGAEGSHARQTS
jgi:hypothetical protein